MKKSSIVETGTISTIFVNFREIFRLLTVDCRVSLSVVVVSFWLSGLGFRLLAVDCRSRLSFTFFTQRWVLLYCTDFLQVKDMPCLRKYCIFT
jgi:hypothetical protein